MASSCRSVRFRRTLAQRMGIRVRCDQRGIAQVGHIPEAPFAQVRQVDHDPEPVALFDQTAPRVGESRAGVRGVWKEERDAVSKWIRPAPHRTERAQAGAVENFQRVEIRIDCFGPFQMQECREDSGLDAILYLACGLHDSYAAGRGALHPEEPSHGGKDGTGGRRQGRRRRERRFPRRTINGSRNRAALTGGTDKDGTETAGKTAPARTRQVHVSTRVLLQEGAACRQPQQHIVMTVENRNESLVP